MTSSARERITSGGITAPVARVLGQLRSELGTHACLGNHDHWTDPEAMTQHLEKNNIRVLINEGFRLESTPAPFWLCGVDDHMVGCFRRKAP